MINITIDKSIFTDWDANGNDHLDFHNFISQAIFRGFTISVSPNVTSDDVGEVQDSNDRALLANALVYQNNLGTTQNPFDGVVKRGGESELTKKIFSLKEIFEYVISPGILILENGLNDGTFFRMVEKYFSPNANFEDKLKFNQVIIDNAGGSDFCGRLKYYLSIHNEEAKFIRCLAIADSDKRYNGDDRYEKKHSDNKQFYNDNGQLYHVLHKRALENYMPDTVFEKEFRQSQPTWVNAYLSLTPNQKDYFCIASGFNKDVAVPEGIEASGYSKFQYLPEGMRSLFATVSEGNFCHLLDGLRIPSPDNFKTKYPRYFEGPYVYKESLLDRTKDQPFPQELHEIAELISKIF